MNVAYHFTEYKGKNHRFYQPLKRTLPHSPRSKPIIVDFIEKLIYDIWMIESDYYLVQEVSTEIPPAQERKVDAWFRQTHAWLKRHDRGRYMFRVPGVEVLLPFYGVSTILKERVSGVELHQHGRDREFTGDHDSISMIIRYGLFPNNTSEQFLVVTDEGELRWYWCEDDYGWKQLDQHAVPLSAIFAVSERVRQLVENQK